MASSPSISLALAPRATGSVPGQEEPRDLQPLVVRVDPPAGAARQPVDLVMVVDVSGSMGNEAKIKSATGVEEAHGLTLLDIAKHGVRTVINSLGDQDRLGVVSFSHIATTVLPLTVMDKAGQKAAEAAVEALVEGGGTNIWNGLEKAFQTFARDSEQAKEGCLAHCMLLTDGQTMNRDSVVTNLQDFHQKHEQLPCTVSTFGFGYDIDSPLLEKIATFGSGTYSFIPDAGFVGTVFINTLSNLLVAMARDVSVSLEVEGAEILDILGDYRTTKTSDGVVVDLGMLQYEQSRSLVVYLSAGTTPPVVAASVTCKLGQPVKEKTLSGGLTEETLTEPLKEAEVDHLRAKYIEMIRKVTGLLAGPGGIEKLEVAQGLVKELAESIQASAVKEDSAVSALLEDVNGQTSEAVSREDWYRQWGRHYLPSIMFAHRVQQCNNFKDASVQVYGGKVFKELQDEADDIFDSLEAPKPRPRPVYGGYRSGPAPAAAPAPARAVNMASYNDRYAGCIDEAALVQLADAAGFRALGELRKGDQVATPDGGRAEVVCLVRTPFPERRAPLVELPGGVRLTPYHPVSVAGAWRFPADLAAARDCETAAVCSVLLAGAAAFVLAGPSPDAADAPATEDRVVAVSLGHGIQEGAARHPFFGSQAVVGDLLRAPGFSKGLVELLPGNVCRDPETGMVTAFKFDQARDA